MSSFQQYLDDEARKAQDARRRIDLIEQDGRDNFGLTVRQLEVLDLIAQGLKKPEIARKLFISFQTVKMHVTHILQKTGARTQAEAVAIAMREGLLK